MLPGNQSVEIEQARRLLNANAALDAARLCETLVGANPANAEAWNLLGIARTRLGQYDAANDAFSRAVAAAPMFADAWANMSASLNAARRYADAVAAADRALAIQPNKPEALANKADALALATRLQEADGVYSALIAARPDLYAVRQARGVLRANLNRTADAIADLDACFAAKQLGKEMVATLAYLRRKQADWRMDAKLVELALKNSATHSAEPFATLAFTDNPALHLSAAKAFAQRFQPFAAPALPRRAPGARIKLAYISADYRRHPITTLLAPLITAHDRARFEVIGISLGPDDGGPERAHILAAFDDVLDARALTDAQIAAWCRERGIDIALDLMGYTTLSRPGIFAQRAAPLQLAFVGAPTTTGAPWIDALVADAVVIPTEEEKHYSERIVRLPHCYHPPNPSLASAETLTRASVGLPEDGLVFASFANTWKIGPEVFDTWCGLLRDVDGSVLWLVDNGADIVANFRREAQQRRVAPERLVFAPWTTHPEHIARQCLADICLDPWPYGGYTTTVEALIAGAPVVTLAGRSFASRIGASMLTTLGAPELIATSLAAYSDIARALARDPERRAALRARIAAQVRTSPLLDLDLYRRNVENLYAHLAQTGV